VHKILLNSVLLSPIVSGGVRPTLPPEQTTLGHYPPCLLPFVGWLESGPHLVGQIGSGVRVSVSFLQKYPLGSHTMSYGSRKRGLWRRVLCPGEVWPPLRRITLSPSHTLCHRLVRTTDDGHCSVLDARRRPSRLCFSQFVTRTVDNTVDLYAAKPDICPESRFLPIPLAFDTPVRGFPSEYRHPVWCGKTRMVGSPDGEKILKICLFVLTWSTNVTDRQTPHDGIGSAYASHRTAKTVKESQQHNTTITWPTQAAANTVRL